MFHRNVLITLIIVLVLISCMLWAKPGQKNKKGKNIQVQRKR